MATAHHNRGGGWNAQTYPTDMTDDEFYPRAACRADAGLPASTRRGFTLTPRKGPLGALDGIAVAEAVEVCRTCPVRTECRKRGLGAPGVWGGDDEPPRRKEAGMDYWEWCRVAIARVGLPGDATELEYR